MEQIFKKMAHLFSLIQLSVLLVGTGDAYSPPSRFIPRELYNDFTLNGKIPVDTWYFDNSYPIEKPLFYSKEVIQQNIEKVKRKNTHYYGRTDLWLYQALEKHPIIDKEVLIVGSSSPWYESVVLAYGGKPTTLEYNKIISDDPRLVLLTVREYEALTNPKKYDLILSISSTEHDGLGRYGDPVNPFGDLQFMIKAKEMVKQNGYMILAVPVGSDRLVWNAHRIYGKIRLPLLLKEWQIVDAFGIAFGAGLKWRDDYQPVFYLTTKENKEETENRIPYNILFGEDKK